MCWGAFHAMKGRCISFMVHWQIMIVIFCFNGFAPVFQVEVQLWSEGVEPLDADSILRAGDFSFFYRNRHLAHACRAVGRRNVSFRPGMSKADWRRIHERFRFLPLPWWGFNRFVESDRWIWSDHSLLNLSMILSRKTLVDRLLWS